MELSQKMILLFTLAVTFVGMMITARNPGRAWRSYVARHYKHPEYHELSTGAIERQRFACYFGMVVIAVAATIVAALPSRDERRAEQRLREEQMLRMQRMIPTTQMIVDERMREAMPRPFVPQQAPLPGQPHPAP